MLLFKICSEIKSYLSKYWTLKYIYILLTLKAFPGINLLCEPMMNVLFGLKFCVDLNKKYILVFCE